MKVSFLFFINSIIIARINCNRCGKANDNIFNQQPSFNNGGNNHMIHHLNEIGEGMNEIYHCPLMKARILLKGNNQEKEINNNFGNRKQFIERPGDWICYYCQNLNFTFRNNCNRCHMPRIENQKLIQNLELNQGMMNVNSQ